MLVPCNGIERITANTTANLDKVPMKTSGREQGGFAYLWLSSSPPGDGIPTVFVAVAGRSNGLGPVMSGNTAYPVVNCPPLSADWGTQDVWSSLRLPSGKIIFSLCCCSDLALFFFLFFSFLLLFYSTQMGPNIGKAAESVPSRVCGNMSFIGFDILIIAKSPMESKDYVE